MRKKWHVIIFLIILVIGGIMLMVGDAMMQSDKRLVGGFWEGYHYEYTSLYYTGEFLWVFGLTLAGMGLIGAIAVWVNQLLNSRKLRLPTIKGVEASVKVTTQTAEPSSRKYCLFCGAENKPQAVFCEKCGRQIS